MVKPSNDTKCPVIVNAENALEKAKDLNKAFRKLRNSLSLCHTCENQDDCPILRDLDSQINTALDELMEEWGYKA